MTRLIVGNKPRPAFEDIGGKTVGLFVLKSLEGRLNEGLYGGDSAGVPPFFVVPPSFDVVKDRNEILEVARSFGANSYAVRSSSTLEDGGEHSFDGIFDTHLRVPLDEIARKVLEVRRSATAEKARRYSAEVGVELVEQMPVVVQAMVEDAISTGVVYSKFPAARDVAKVVREREGERYIDIFSRIGEEGKFLFAEPLVQARDSRQRHRDASKLVDMALKVELMAGHPVIIEFAVEDLDKRRYNLLQARRLTKLMGDERTEALQINDRGFVCSTYDLSGMGEFTGTAFVLHDPDARTLVEKISNTSGLELFDRDHPEGYVLVTPCLEFFNTSLDAITQNARAVVAYEFHAKHHDLELARKREIVYLNASSTISRYYHGPEDNGRVHPIRTGETVRVVSDGEQGFVYNLSREQV